MDVLRIDVPAALVPHVQSALARLGYLHADVEWTFDAEGNRVNALYAPDKRTPEDLRKDALFQLYREKIHHDTLSIRDHLYEAI